MADPRQMTIFDALFSVGDRVVLSNGKIGRVYYVESFIWVEVDLVARPYSIDEVSHA